MLDKTIKLKRVVLEVKYSGGHLYWDKCGDTVRKIELNFPEWKFTEIAVEGARLLNQERNQQLIYYWNRIVLIQENVENLNQFKKSSEVINQIAQNIEVPEYSRIGNRYWFVKPVSSVEEGEKILNSSSFLTFDINKIEGLGEKILNRGVVLITQLDDKKIRLAVNTISVTTGPNIALEPKEYNPKHAVLLDFDIFADKLVMVNKFDSGDFIQKAYKILENNALKALK
ncbi:MAG: hypothetical protein QME51_06220 [Planctomycetota bacterium]|nr:hypothetical protein [Planctomycetota bacterium]